MNKSEKFWDRTASQYDQEEEKDKQTYIEIIGKTRRYLKSSDTVLDFGCGTGLVGNEIADLVKTIHAVDMSSRMIEIAKKKAEGRQIENIDYAHSTIFDERYMRGSFDIILAFYVLHLLEDTHQVMQRISELLKPGGLLISATPCMGEKRTLQSILWLLSSKAGLVPTIRSFRTSELEEAMTNVYFEMVETGTLTGSSEQYFIVAKKKS